MAGKRAAPKKPAAKKPARKPAARKTAPELVFEEGYWWMVSGTKRVNVGRNRRYAETYLAEHS